MQEDQIDLVLQALMKAERMGVPIFLPQDHLCGTRFVEDTSAIVSGIDIPDPFLGLDIGPKTSKFYADRIAAARTVVWNGPMGVFEWPAFRAGTQAVARAVADCPGYTVVGGGDSVAAVEQAGLSAKIKHISTGGGASLELLEGKDLPGIAVLAQKRAR